ncbi:MAG: hypothetical protein ACLFV3_11675 [Phycisphaeraceae bacterium]
MLLTVAPAWALVNGEAPAGDERQFDAVGAFSRSKWILPGGEQEHRWFGAATLVAPDRILTARHLLPDGQAPDKPGQFAVRFRRRPDGGLGSKQAGAESYHHVRITRWKLAPRGDLAIGYLEDPVTHIRPMPVRLEPLELDGEPGQLAAWGSESRWMGEAAPRRGLRVGETRLQHERGGGMVRFVDWRARRKQKGTDDAGRPVFKPWISSDAAVPNMYDSGGAVLVKRDGRWQLAGIVSTYTHGTWLAPFADRAGFPLAELIAGEDGADR